MRYLLLALVMQSCLLLIAWLAVLEIVNGYLSPLLNNTGAVLIGTETEQQFLDAINNTEFMPTPGCLRLGAGQHLSPHLHIRTCIHIRNLCSFRVACLCKRCCCMRMHLYACMGMACTCSNASGQTAFTVYRAMFGLVWDTEQEGLLDLSLSMWVYLCAFFASVDLSKKCLPPSPTP